MAIVVSDEYSLATLQPVPFSVEDSAALGDALAAAVAVDIALPAVRIKGAETAAGLNELLAGQSRKMPLRRKDVMVAYVRGQCLVAPPLFDADGVELPDRLSGRPCLVAADATVQGPRIRELVPIRDIVEAIGSASPYTTLVALDLGSLSWDPRLGVLANLVARQLDREFAAPQQEATFSNWVIGSHDLFEISLVNGPARRTLFSYAVERALAGDADARPWGNANRIVELDELARFVATLTNIWAGEGSGGRRQQHPVVWKLGQGRVELDAIPKGIALVRVAPPVPPSPPQPTTTKAGLGEFVSALFSQRLGGHLFAQQEAGLSLPDPNRAAAPPAADGAQPAADAPQPKGDAAEPPVAAPQPTDKPAEKKSDAPATPAAQPPPPQPLSLYELVDALAARRMMVGQNSGPSPAAQPVAPGAVGSDNSSPLTAVPAPLDYAPHVWRWVVADAAASTIITGTPTVAAATAAPPDNDPEGAAGPAAEPIRTAITVRDGLTTGLAKLVGLPSDVGPVTAKVGSIEQLQRAAAAARANGFFLNWAAAPERFRTAIATRDDAVETLLTMLEVVGRLSGGTQAPLIEPAIFSAAIEQTAALSAAIETMPAARLDAGLGRIDPVATLTRIVAAQSAVLVEIADRLADTAVGYKRGTSIMVRPDIVAPALRIPQLSSDQRQRLIESMHAMAPGQPAVAGSTETALPQPEGLMPPADSSPRRIRWGDLENIRQQVGAVASLVDAAGVVSPAAGSRIDGLTMLSARLANVRRALARLAEPAEDDQRMIDSIVSLGGQVAQLLAEIAEAAGSPRERAARAGEAVPEERRAALFRIMDVRDVSRLSELNVVGLPQWQPGETVRPVITGTAELPTAGLPAPCRIRLATDGLPPPASTLRLVYDPAELTVRLSTSEALPTNRPIPTRDLPFRGDELVIEVTANRFASADRNQERATLSAVFETNVGSQTASLDFLLPVDRGVSLQLRRTPRTADGDSDGWIEARREPSPSSDSSTAETLFQETAVTLEHLVGQETVWELALVNRAAIAREMEVEVYSVPDGSPLTDDSDAWSRARDLLRDGVAGSLDLLSLVKTVALPASTTPVVLALPPAAAPEPLPAPDSAAAAASPVPTKAPARLIGPDLAVVVRERTKGEPARIWIHRLRLTVGHPSAWLRAVARWNQQARIIDIAVEPTGLQPIPPGGLTCRLELLDPAPVARQPVAIRRGEVSLTPTRPRDSLAADYNGGDLNGRAWLTLSVNGYPRAFVFGVDCSAAAADRPQPPLDDWRMIAFRRPQRGMTLLQAPQPSVPVSILVDAPPDAVGRQTARDTPRPASDPLVEILVREVRTGLLGQAAANVWSANRDRRRTFKVAAPRPPASLVLVASADDWTLDAATGGLADVDAELEARLRLPGSQQPIADRRLLVLDATPPRVEAPPQMNVVVGRPLTIPIRVLDDPREGFGGPEGVHIPGVAGVERVDWAVDLKGDGKPEAWQAAVALGGGRYELRVDTKLLPPGRQTPVLVRALDRVGNTATPSQTWLDTAVQIAKGSIRGKVTLDGRGERGLTVEIDGPSAPRPVTSAADGAFEFKNLDPGQYTLRSSGAVRNRLYRTKPTPVTVEAPPAAAATVTLELESRSAAANNR